MSSNRSVRTQSPKAQSLKAMFGVLVILLVSATPLYAAEGGQFPRIVNFAIVAAALFFAVRKPLGGYLVARTEQIRAELSEAKQKLAEAAEERKQADTLLASLDEEVDKARAEATRAAEAEKTRILTAAKAEAERIQAIAAKEIEAEVEAGRRKLLARAAELSVSLAHRKLESTMTDADHAKLVDRSIALLEKKS